MTHLAHPAAPKAAAAPRWPYGSVEAALCFVAAGETRPRIVVESGAQPPHHQGRTSQEKVVVLDGRPVRDSFALDLQGFELRTHRSRATDFDNDAHIDAVYIPEVEAVIAAATGAARVEVFDHTVRRDNAAAGRRPARHVHVDYTDRSAPHRIRELFGDEAEALLERRHMQVNLWRPIGRRVLRSPLALLDARTVAEGDLVPTPLLNDGREGEIFGLRNSPEHRWWFFPEMEPDEALLIKGYDSLNDGRARFTPHSAFDDPTSSPAAPPRASIEVRAFAFFNS